MKRFYWIAALCAVFSTSAQDVVDTMAQEACACMNAKNLDLNGMPPSQLEMEFASCFMTAYGSHMDEYNKQYNVVFGDEAAMEALGEKVAVKMISHCPDVLLALGNLADDEAPLTTATGVVTDIKYGDFVTVYLKDQNNITHQFLLLRNFDSAPVMETLRKNDELTVSYAEEELYDAKAKVFRFYEVIYGLQK
jgi:hypothetical protein